MKSKLQQKRKFLLVLPVIVILFGTFTAWSLGLVGGASVQEHTSQDGVNPLLPQARLSEKATDKMSLYNEAERDSLARKQASGTDPFAASDSLLPGYHTDDSFPAESATAAAPPYYSGYNTNNGYMDPNERKVRERLAGLEQALSDPETTGPEGDDRPSYGEGYPQHTDIQKLEQMMADMSSTSAQDEETRGLSELMEKVLDVQYPQRAMQKLREQSEKNKGRVYSVALKQHDTRAEVMNRPGTETRARLVDSGTIPVYEPIPEQTGFYSLQTAPQAGDLQTAIPAVIHGTQTLLTGSTVKMRLTEEVMVNGMVIPAGTFVYGTCGISGERLLISIPGIRYGKHQIPVALKAFGLDGLEGIRVPGAITRDAVKDGTGQVVQSMQMTTLDPSVYAQAAGVGVEVAKGLFSKKAKLVRATVKADEPLLLVDEKSLQDMN